MPQITTRGKFTENIIRDDLQLYPRVPDSSTKHDTRFDRSTYVSIQSRVNNDPVFEEKYINKLQEDGWVALKNIKDIFLYPRGKYFKYRLNGNSMSKAPEGTFRSGGMFLGRNDNEEDESVYNNYILYKAYNGAIFSLQISDILEIYIKSPTKERALFKKPDPNAITKYPVMLENMKTNKLEIVYYAKDSNQKTRFMNTAKYKKARATGNWSWATVFNDDF